MNRPTLMLCTVMALMPAALRAGIGDATLPTACPKYAASGPITVTKAGQSIRNLTITSTAGPAITINGFKNVKVSNVIIYHANGPGIEITNAPGVTVEKADIYNTGAPGSGAAATADEINVSCEGSPKLKVKDVRLQRGSSGVFMLHCDDSNLSNIEGHDVRGPFPRGQLVQWDQSRNGKLTNFSSENSLINSWPEDLVNIYKSDHISLKNGYLDGNNSVSGDGVMVDELSHDIKIENVDAVRQMNGCFGVYGGGGYNVTMNRTGCVDTICSSSRGAPLSGSLGWAVDPASKGGIQIKSSTYYNLCNPGNIVWEDDAIDRIDIKQASRRSTRPQVRVKLCSTQ